MSCPHLKKIAKTIPYPQFDPLNPEYGNQTEIDNAISNASMNLVFEKWAKEFGPVFKFYEINREHQTMEQTNMQKTTQCPTPTPTFPPLLTRLVVASDASIELMKTFTNKIPQQDEIPIFTDAILSTNKMDRWNLQRDHLKPQLSQSAVMSHHKLILEEINKILQSIEKTFEENVDATPTPTPRIVSLDLYPILNHMTFNMIVHTALGIDTYFKDEEIDEIRDAFDTCVFMGIARTDPEDEAFMEAKNKVSEYVDRIINNVVPAPNTIYGKIMLKENDQYIFTETERRNLITTFLFAGHETTANTIYWTLLELARNPPIQNKLWQGVKNINLDHDPMHLFKYSYLTGVIHESMRMWPVVTGGNFRTIDREIELFGEKFQPGTIILFPTYLIHRSPAYWEKPEEFNPERKFDHRYFFPFSRAPRDCLGRNLAMLEIRLFITGFVQKFEFEFENQQDAHNLSAYDMGTIRPKGEIKLRIKKRVEFFKSKI
jgi:cytochrome P450